MPLNVLVIDRAAPVDARQGNSLIAMEVMRRLAHHRLVLVAPAPSPDQDLGLLREAFDEVHLVPRKNWIPAITGSFEPLVMRGLPRFAAMDLPAARRLSEVVMRLAKERRFDVVHVRQLPMARYARLVPHRPKLLELIDSETLGAERARPRTARSVLRSRLASWVERRAIGGFDIVTTVAEADRRRVAALRPDLRIEVVPNGVDAERFTSTAGPDRRGATLVFVGAMSYGPNVAAMQWFCADVLPRVRARCPEARLLIVGRDPSPSVRELADGSSIVVTGEVDDVRPYLDSATVFVAPMVSGSGIKNKVLEAMSMALPVVATPLAVEGLAADHDTEVVVAADATAMADQVVRLLRDAPLRQKLGSAARRRVEGRYTWDVCAASYDRLWHELAAVQA